VKGLFAVSQNRCAFPKCPTPAHDGNSVLVQVCHIEGDKPDSARYRKDQPDRERHGFANLILLCGTHHKIIDDDEESYTVERLRKIKAQAEAATPSPDNDENERVGKLLFTQILEHLEAIREDSPLLPVALKQTHQVDIKGLATRLSDMGMAVFMVLHDLQSKTLTLWVDVPRSSMAELKSKWAAIATIASESPGTEHIDIGTCDASALRGTDGRGHIGKMRVRIPIESARELATSRRLRPEFWQNASVFIIEPSADNTGFQQWFQVPFSNLEVPLAASR
jgi:hypothetical protein